MPHLDVPPWAWIAFNAYVVGLLLLDLYGFNKKAHEIHWREAAWLSAFFVGASLAVNAVVWVAYGHAAGVTFLTAYLVEKSLSVDNLFVIAVLFGYFSVPPRYQHRVLFWGIFGAIVMRAVMILVGVALVDRFHWVLYIFGAFLVLKARGCAPLKWPSRRTFLRKIVPIGVLTGLGVVFWLAGGFIFDRRDVCTV